MIKQRVLGLSALVVVGVMLSPVSVDAASPTPASIAKQIGCTNLRQLPNVLYGGQHFSCKLHGMDTSIQVFPTAANEQAAYQFTCKTITFIHIAQAYSGRFDVEPLDPTIFANPAAENVPARAVAKKLHWHFRSCN